MPQPDRAERAAVRERLKKFQQDRNAESFKANGYTDHDDAAMKQARAERQKAQASAAKAAETASKRRAGSSRTVPPSSQAKAGAK